jgi:hypothetical protein
MLGGQQMKKNPWKYLSATLGILLAITIGLWQTAERDVHARIERDLAFERAQLELKLSKWIYDRSERISRTTCEEIAREAMKTKNPALTVAIMEIESIKFTPGALSTIRGAPGAMGWMQVRWEVHSEALVKAGIAREKRDLWDTPINIRSGAFIFEDNLKASKGDVSKALSAYLGGQDGVYLLRILSNFASLSVKESQPKEGKPNVLLPIEKRS